MNDNDKNDEEDESEDNSADNDDGFIYDFLIFYVPPKRNNTISINFQYPRFGWVQWFHFWLR